MNQLFRRSSPSLRKISGAGLWPVLLAAMMLAAGCSGDSGGSVATDGQNGGSDAATDAAASSGSGMDATGSSDTVAASVAPGAGPATLGIGDPAPPLQIASWYKGDEIGAFEEGKIYVVEFWATWCGPCRQSMPHMADLQQQYGDEVQFIGVTDESSSEVAKFMKEQAVDGKTWGEVVNYSIALDTTRQTNLDYMAAAKLQGIPNAFIVGKQGVIQWIGHPLGMDNVLQQVVDGVWDPEKVKAEFALETKVRAAMQEKKDWLIKTKEMAAAATGDEAEAHWDAALKAVDEMLALVPDDATSPRLVGARDELQQVQQWLLGEAGRSEQLNALQAELVEQHWESPQTLDSIAWRIASSQQDGDLALAEKAAKQAVKLTDQKNPSPLETLARVYYAQDDLEAAIAAQQQAVDVAGDSPAAKRYQSKLEEYQAEQAEQGGKS